MLERIRLPNTYACRVNLSKDDYYKGNLDMYFASVTIHILEEQWVIETNNHWIPLMNRVTFDDALSYVVHHNSP